MTATRVHKRYYSHYLKKAVRMKLFCAEMYNNTGSHARENRFREPLVFYVKENTMGQAGSGLKEYYLHRQLVRAGNRGVMQVAVFEKLGS